MAALQTRMSMRPNRALVFSTSASTSALREMLQGMAAASPPCSAISRATSSHASALRLEITTLAPSADMLSARARPMPRLDPVMTATLSSRWNGVFMCARSRQKRAAARVDGLAGDVARARAAQEAHKRGDVLRCAACARQRVMDRVMLRLDEVLRARRGHEARGDAVHRHIVAGEIAGERAGEPGETGFGRQYVGAILRTGVGAQAAHVDDRPGAALLQMRQARLGAMEGAVEGDVEHAAPFRIGHVLQPLLP